MFDSSRLVIILTLISGCNYVLSCEITIFGQSPLFTKDFGSKTIVFKAHGSTFMLEESETIKAYCRGMQVVASRNYNYNSRDRQTISLPSDDAAIFKCVSSSITILGQSYEKVDVTCPAYPRLGFYESNKKLPKCTNFMSYAFGFKLQEMGDVIKTAVCYDLDHLELKFASYVAYESKVLMVNKLHIGNELSVNLRQELNGFKNYFDFINQESEIVSKSSEKLHFNAKEFQFDNLLQDEPLTMDLSDFKYIFNIMWWRQLRQENWRFFLDALKERTETAKYLIHVGTFGNVTIPTMQTNCTSSKSEVVSISNEDMTIKAPGYIWAYLKSITPGLEEEFVVIGHNSPYKKNPDHSEFCEADICDKFDWLKNSQFGNLRQLSTLGYTFCCHPEEVAKKFDYFPFEVRKIATSTPGDLDFE